MHISVEPTEHGEQLRLSTRNEAAVALNGVGLVTGGMLLLMGAVVAAAVGACAHAAARADRPAFRGVYRVGPGISAFRPCGSDQEWYVAPSTTSALELQRRTSMKQDEAPRGGMRTEAPAGADAGSFQRAYVEVQGDTVALTAGPEVRRYTRELRPTRVLLVERAVEAPKRCGTG